MMGSPPSTAPWWGRFPFTDLRGLLVYEDMLLLAGQLDDAVAAGGSGPWAARWLERHPGWPVAGAPPLPPVWESVSWAPGGSQPVPAGSWEGGRFRWPGSACVLDGFDDLAAVVFDRPRLPSAGGHPAYTAALAVQWVASIVALELSARESERWAGVIPLADAKRARAGADTKRAMAGVFADQLPFLGDWQSQVFNQPAPAGPNNRKW